MAGLKRKESPAVKTSGGRVQKKVRTDNVQDKREKRPVPEPEAETDSDPINESDTTEHSGDDDGASWPSDDEETTVASKKRKLGVEDGEVKGSEKTKGIDKSATSNGAANCEFGYLPREVMTGSLGSSYIIERSSCEAEGSRARTQSGEAERRLRSTVEENMGALAEEVPRTIGGTQSAGG